MIRKDVGFREMKRIKIQVLHNTITNYFGVIKMQLAI